jgi:hypothetical protein
MILGGVNKYFLTLSSTELFDPVGNSSTPSTPMLQGRAHHKCLYYNREGEQVLVLGGTLYNGSLITQAETFHVNDSLFYSVGNMMSGRLSFEDGMLTDGHTVLIAGGSNGKQTLQTAEIFDFQGTIQLSRRSCQLFYQLLIRVWVPIHSLLPRNAKREFG